jgi:hypothetical protein
VTVVGLSACASVKSVDSNADFATATRAAPVDASVAAPTSDAGVLAPDLIGNLKVVSLNVDVPQSLVVSEANRYLPSGDIVWREDPIGDRHAQVKAILEAGLTAGAAPLNGEREVVVDIVLTRFHALTEKARYTVGGLHNIKFGMRVRDAATGEVLMGPKHVNASLDALGGTAAIQAENRGITQKVRITNHLAQVIRKELSDPEGFTSDGTTIATFLN